MMTNIKNKLDLSNSEKIWITKNNKLFKNYLKNKSTIQFPFDDV